MLKPDDLKSQIAASIKNIIVPAIEQCMKSKAPEKSERGDTEAENFAKAFDEQVSEQFADALANAIDYYIKNADITGNLITNGSPTTHICTIAPPPTPVAGGKIPNTLGIS